MRLFVGLRPAAGFRDALSALQDRLRAAGVTARYLEPSDLHMTLAFIGEWAEDVTGFLPHVGRPFPITLSELALILARKEYFLAGSMAMSVCSFTWPCHSLPPTPSGTVRVSLPSA